MSSKRYKRDLHKSIPWQTAPACKKTRASVSLCCHNGLFDQDLSTSKCAHPVIQPTRPAAVSCQIIIRNFYALQHICGRLIKPDVLVGILYANLSWFRTDEDCEEHKRTILDKLIPKRLHEENCKSSYLVSFLTTYLLFLHPNLRV